MQLEMCQGDYALAMTSIFDSEEGFDRLYAALEEIDKKEAAARRTITPQFLTEVYAKRTVRISIAEALDAKTVARWQEHLSIFIRRVSRCWCREKGFPKKQWQ